MSECKDKMPRRCGETGGYNSHCPLMNWNCGSPVCAYDSESVSVNHACHHGLWKRGPILFTDKEVFDPGVELRPSKLATNGTTPGGE